MVFFERVRAGFSRSAARAVEACASIGAWLLQHVTRVLGPRFPIVLALIMSAAAVVDAFYLPFMRGLETRSYDLILRHRLIAAGPDPDIVVIDIDEKSLAAMAEEYGRWPWPRAVLAEVLEEVERQGARAVFFDVLFADPDTQNPSSDELFNQAVADSSRSFFAMLRLDKARDGKSQLHASQVPGSVRVVDDSPPGTPGDDPTVAMILPRFPAIIDSGRVGTVDADPDHDGVVRRFALYEDAGDWRIPSLPLSIGSALGMKIPGERDIQLNWRGPPFTYRFVSFADVHADSLRKVRQRDPREFAGKIVLIGSTAPALFDLRASPMARVHPGVEILATAIDNLKNADYYRRVGKAVSLAISLALIWSLALGLRSLQRGSTTGPIVFTVQTVLLIVAYVSLNVTHYYLDLVAPFTFGIVLFLLMNLRADLRERAAQLGQALSTALERGARYRLLLLIIEPMRPRLRGRTRSWLIDRVCASRAGARLADPPYRGRGILGADFAGVCIAYWVAREADEAGASAAAEEREAFAAGVSKSEPSGVTMARREAVFEWSGDRPGVVGRALLDALQDLRRTSA